MKFMKVMKRMSAAIIAMVIVLAMCIPVSAEGTETTNVYIHKYQMPEDATDLKNDGTQINDLDLEGLTPVKGITFTIYKAALKDNAAVGSTTPGDYNLVKYDASTTDANGQILFIDVPNGLYYVEETKSAASTDPTGFFLSLPMTNPTGNDTLDEVHVYPKNTMTDASITKTLLDVNGEISSTGSADVGSDVTWRIISTLPGEIANADATTASSDYYEITDVLNASLTYKSAAVYLGNTKLTADTDYILTSTANGDKTTTVKISFTKTQLEKLVAAMATSDATITVDITTTINENAYDGIQNATNNYTITNEASYEWKVGGDDENGKTDPENPPVVTVTGLLIYKTDENDNPLKGASFMVANYDKSQEGYEKITNDNGYAYWSAEEVVGISLNNDGLGIFYALENVPPKGYAKITGYQAFEELTSTNLSAALTIKNYPSGFELPHTGGIGTLLFTIGGLILIAIACVIIVIRKKKSEKNNYVK